MNYDINRFDELGYVIVKDFMGVEEHMELHMEQLRLTEVGMLRTDNGDGWVMNEPHNPCKLDGAMLRSPVFRRLGRHRNLVPIAKTLLKQNNLDTYISKFFPMMPRNGFSVDWHQDNHYIQADANRLVSCDVFIHGATKEKGCLRLIPGSHHELRRHTKNAGVFNWLYVGESSDIVDIEIDELFAIFFHPNLVHGCYKNTSLSYRPSVAWEYIETGYIPPTHNGHQSQDRIQV
jgi:ectoine hydroxylase-related dioxygenase (phytanoyl-CoA dioxygenase family)